MNNHMFFNSLSLVAAALLGAAGLLAGSVSAAAEPPFEVVASGLDNPRGLAFAPNGALYVAEAGRGGDTSSLRLQYAGNPIELFFGATGAITEVLDRVQTRVVTGLPSKAQAGGYRAAGPDDLALGPGNVAFVVTGLGLPEGTPALREAFDPAAADLGRLLRVDLKEGTWESVADLAAYEAAHDPDGAGVDSNPYALLSMPGCFIVPDAGGNDLLSVKYNGEVSTLALFPNWLVDAPPSLGLPPGAQIPLQSVPTTVVLGPDAALYVGEFTGRPFPVGGARVYQLTPGSEPKVFAAGFTNIIDMEFRPPDGLLCARACDKYCSPGHHRSHPHP
jgi:hypothetical protein